MASSRVMASSSSANSDLTRQSSLFSLALVELQSSASGDQGKNLGSMNMEDILQNIYGDNPATEFPPASAGGELEGAGGGGSGAGSRGERGMLLPRQGSLTLPKGAGRKTVDEVWRDISCGDRKVVDGDGSEHKTVGYAEMTLEDFLARAVSEEDVGGASGPVQQQVDSSILGFGMDSVLGDRFALQQQHQQLHQQQVEGPFMGLVNGVEGARAGGGRGKRRALQEPVDKVVQQRQRRMIKNRESAARSRERKQAYTVELESFVTTLEEENASLVRQQEERKMTRLKQLMEYLIPVVEMKRPPRRLRRTCSVQW